MARYEYAAPFTLEEMIAGMSENFGLDRETVITWVNAMWGPDSVQTRAGLLGAALELESYHSAIAVEQLLGPLVILVRGKAGVVDFGERRLSLGPACDGEAVDIVSLHSQRQCPHPPVHHPGCVRVDRLAPEPHQPVDLLDQRR